MRLPLARYDAALRRRVCRGSSLLRGSRSPPQSTFSPSRCYATEEPRGIRPIARNHVNDIKRKELNGLWTKYHGVEGPLDIGDDGTCVGFIGKRRDIGKHLAFADLTLPSGEIIQLCSRNERSETAHAEFRAIRPFSPVVVRTSPAEEKTLHPGSQDPGSRRTVDVDGIRQLNDFPSELIVTPEVQFSPQQRHLQLRFHPELQARLRFRSWLKGVLNQALVDKGFTDIETPALFKSTTEGAREFLVPSRLRGRAYALSQSPQQYKQVLMAGGFSRYMQWARCFRDEDLRADRQPEFSQLDMEWAFAGAATVKKDVNDIVLRALKELRPARSYRQIRGEIVPVVSSNPSDPPGDDEPVTHQLTDLTFAESIAAYGTDKPDLRIPLRIHAIEDLEPFRNFVGMITHLEDPLIEAFALPTEDCEPLEVLRVITEFMDNLQPSFSENPDGKPQVLIYDSSKPMCGFSSMGFEYEGVLDKLSGGQELSDGDVVVFQARKKVAGQYLSASTKLGEIRGLLWKTLVDAKCTKPPPQLGEPGSLQFVWVSEFPMFKLVEAGELGQESPSGAAATHHPFTSPLSQTDLDLLFTDPMQAKSAAYDLVLNGVEVGGGSVRNHVVQIQEYIMKHVLRMSTTRINDFAHLFEALRSGCPPHAGFALGFDRLAALMSGTPTVRDVIAFPKSMKGEDLFAGSPGKLYTEQLLPYGLIVRSGAKRSSLFPRK